MGHYEVLGLRPSASSAEVRAAYVALARRHHPDRTGGSTERMQALNAAWAVLGDVDARRSYDLTLRTPPAPPRPSPAGRTGGPDPQRRPPDPDLADLDDDRPIHGVVRLPPWMAMVPPGLVLLAALVFIGGLVFRSAAVVAFAAVLGLLGLVGFVVSPFVALAASRRNQ